MPVIDKNATVSAIHHREALDEIDYLRRKNAQLERQLKLSKPRRQTEDHLDRVMLTACEAHLANVVASKAPTVASMNEVAKNWPTNTDPSRNTLFGILMRARNKLRALEVEIVTVPRQGWRMSTSDAEVVKRLCRENE